MFALGKVVPKILKRSALHERPVVQVIMDDMAMNFTYSTQPPSIPAPSVLAYP